MAKFSFKFQSILSLKLQMEDSLKNELGKAVAQWEREKEILRELDEEQEQLISSFNDNASKGVTVEKLKEYNGYISLLNTHKERQKENIKLKGQIVDKYREELIKAVQERRILEKLKEKMLDEYLKEQLKLEQKLTDEVVSFNYSEGLAGDRNG